MKYKVLLTGSNKKVINEFFYQMDFSFESMSSSMVFDDLKNHVNYFKPDVFVFCMNNESRDDVTSISNFHHELNKKNIPYVVIGDSSSLDFVSKIPNGNPDLSLRVGMSAIDISEELTSFIKKYKTQGSFEELSSATPVPDTKVETKVEADTDSAPKSDTADIMAKIDAQLQAMEKVGATTTNNVETVERQPELPGRHRVLVIDDATIVHKTIKAYLNPEYEVATAISGKVALRFLMAKDVSLILLDYEMPEMDGPAVLTKIRENPELADIPVVFLTGINDVDKIKSALALKPQGYLLKPVDAKALMNKMHEIVK